MKKAFLKEKYNILKRSGKYLVYISLVCYLIIRYSYLGLILAKLWENLTPREWMPVAIQEAEKPKNIADLFLFISIMVIFSSLLYFVIFRFQKILEFITKLRLTAKSKLAILIFLIFLTLVYGLNKYTVEDPDEVRDWVVFNIVANHGLNAYLNNVEAGTLKNTMNKLDFESLNLTRLAVRTHSTIKSGLDYLAWARRLHPPFYYLFAGLLSRGISGIKYYRFLFILFFVIWLSAIILSSLRCNISSTFLYCFVIIPFIFKYIRNCTLINLGNEFFSFIGFTSFMLILYLFYEKKIKLNIISTVLLFISLFIAIWSKFSAIVAAISLVCSFGLCMLSFSDRVISDASYKRKIFPKMFIVTLLLFTIVIVLYFLTFKKTFMLEQQWNSYVGRLSDYLFFIPKPLNYIKFTGFVSIKDFFVMAVFWYGPLLIAGLIYGLYRLSCHLKNFHKICAFDCLMIFWLLIDVFIILLVEPRARYTIPLSFSFIYLISRGLGLTKNYLLARQYFLICILFTCTEVLLKSFFY